MEPVYWRSTTINRVNEFTLDKDRFVTCPTWLPELDSNRLDAGTVSGRQNIEQGEVFHRGGTEGSMKRFIPLSR